MRLSAFVRTGLCVLLLGAAAGVAISPAGAADPTAPPRVPSQGLLFGASVEAQGSLDFHQEMADLESRLGRTVAVDRSFSRWDDPQPSTLVTDDLAHGRVPLLSISTLERDGTKVQWAAIASGAEDAAIRTQADALRDTRGPMLLAFEHEADLRTGYGTPADFIKAFQHYVTVFRQQGATNVAFTLILTPHAYDSASTWYPGASYVDWLGTDAYNFGSCEPGLSGWHSLQYAAQPFYDWAAKTGKPLVLAEWGSAADPNDPGRRAQWLRDAATTLAGWPAIKAAVYYDRDDTCDWRVDDDSASFAALQALAHSSLANGRPTAGLVASVPVGPAPLATTLTMARSTGGQSLTGSGITAWTLDFGDRSPTVSGHGQPSSVRHNYTAGTWTASLTVTDAVGRLASTTVSVIAAAAPTVAQADPRATTATSATVPGWIQTNSLTGSYYVEWGTSQSYGHRSATFALAAKSYSQAVLTTLTGLTSGVTYHWRTVAVTAAGTGSGHDRTFVL